MGKRNFFKFVFAGLLTMVAGEFQVNILVLNRGVSDYAGTLIIYLLSIAIMYLSGVFLDHKISSKKADLFYYFLGGMLGLAIEWFLIGNAPWIGTGAIQAGMFAWWSAVFLIPRIFTTPTNPTVMSVRNKIFATLVIYSLVSTLIVAAISMGSRPGIAAIMLTVSFLVINFQFIPYLVRNGLSILPIRVFMWFLVLLSIVNLFI